MGDCSHVNGILLSSSPARTSTRILIVLNDGSISIESFGQVCLRDKPTASYVLKMVTSSGFEMGKNHPRWSLQFKVMDFCPFFPLPVLFPGPNSMVLLRITERVLSCCSSLWALLPSRFQRPEFAIESVLRTLRANGSVPNFFCIVPA